MYIINAVIVNIINIRLLYNCTVPKQTFFAKMKLENSNTIQLNPQLLLSIYTSVQSFCTCYWFIMCIQPYFSVLSQI